MFVEAVSVPTEHTAVHRKALTRDGALFPVPKTPAAGPVAERPVSLAAWRGSPPLPSRAVCSATPPGPVGPAGGRPPRGAGGPGAAGGSCVPVGCCWAVRTGVLQGGRRPSPPTTPRFRSFKKPSVFHACVWQTGAVSLTHSVIAGLATRLPVALRGEDARRAVARGVRVCEAGRERPTGGRVPGPGGGGAAQQQQLSGCRAHCAPGTRRALCLCSPPWPPSSQFWK